MRFKSKYSFGGKFFGLIALMSLFLIFGPFAFITLFFGLTELFKQMPTD